MVSFACLCRIVVSSYVRFEALHLYVMSAFASVSEGSIAALRRLGLAPPLQPAARVPSFHHFGFNGTNGNRHPGSSVLSATSLSPNPNLHDSLGCPVTCRKRSTSKPILHQLKKQKTKTSFVFYMLDEMHIRAASRDAGGRSRAYRMYALRPIGQTAR